jgi:hypothetical protein
MLANTKQIRTIIKQAIVNCGAHSSGSWTEGADRGTRTRYVGYQFGIETAKVVAKEARILAAKAGYENDIRTSASKGYYSAGYVRVTADLG